MIHESTTTEVTNCMETTQTTSNTVADVASNTDSAKKVEMADSETETLNAKLLDASIQATNNVPILQPSNAIATQTIISTVTTGSVGTTTDVKKFHSIDVQTDVVETASIELQTNNKVESKEKSLL